MSCSCCASGTPVPNRWGVIAACTMVAYSPDPFAPGLCLLHVIQRAERWFLSLGIATSTQSSLTCLPCLQVLYKAFPDVRIVSDIRSLGELPVVGPVCVCASAGTVLSLISRCLCVQGTQMVVAGFPCTDISTAGKRKGITGPVRCPRLPLRPAAVSLQLHDSLTGYL